MGKPIGEITRWRDQNVEDLEDLPRQPKYTNPCPWRTHIKEAAFGRPPLWFPLWVLVFVYFGLLGYISVLLGHLLTLLPYQLSRQIV